MTLAKQIAAIFLATVAFFLISCSDESSNDNPLIPEVIEELSSAASSSSSSSVTTSSSSYTSSNSTYSSSSTKSESSSDAAKSSSSVILSETEKVSSSSSSSVILSEAEGSSNSSAKSSSSSSRHSGLDPESSSTKIASSSSSSRNNVNSSSSSAKSSSSIKPSSSSIAKPSSSSKNVILSSSEGSSSSSSQAKSNSSVKSSSSSAKSSSSSSRHSGLDPESSSSWIASSSSSSRNDVNSSSSSAKSSSSIKPKSSSSSSSSVKSSSGKSLNGKTWFVIGDSFSTGDAFSDLDPIPIITDGKYAGQRPIYPYLIGNRTGCNVQNIAVSGTTISDVNGAGFTNPKKGLLFRTNFSKADIITIYYGINDSHNSVPIGTIDDTDPSTFYGAYNTVIDYLTTNYPNAKIGIIISNGCDSPDYPDATENIAQKWGLPYLDIDGGVNGITMLRSSSRNPATAEEKRKALLEQRVSSTNWHPNEYAHELESHFIEDWLTTLF